MRSLSRVRLSWLGSLACLAACGPPVPDASPANGAAPLLSFEPNATGDRVSSVVHLHVANARSAALALFQGQLSTYYVSKLQHGEVPQTLEARRIPLVSWDSESVPEFVATPLRPLPPSDYSLVSGDGLLGTFHVGASIPLLSRIWPPPSVMGDLEFAVYCATSGEALAAVSANAASLASPASFAPSAVEVAFSPGVDDEGSLSERCVHFTSDVPLAAGDLLVPPPRLGDVALDPALFGGAGSAPAVALDCTARELPIGLGCAVVGDDRFVLRTPEEALLWTVHTERGALLEVTRSGSSLTLFGLLPQSREHIWGTVRDLSGVRVSFDLQVTTSAPSGRPILNEVLADALGPEPASEWVELFNDGTLAVDLSDYRLQDGGGSTPLPQASLGPKEFALLVGNDFMPNDSDVPPAPGARLIRLASLGKSGLSNAGERLALIDRTGVECSVLPARQGKPGQSLARISTSAPDGDPQSFRFGTPTPGFANVEPAEPSTP